MKLKLLHLYGDIMNLYGEYANIAILERYLTDLGHEVQTDTLCMYEQKDISGYDLYYMGAGTEQKMKRMLPELLKHRESLQTAMERNKLLLFTGNACDLLGTSITDAEGKRYECLGFGCFESVEGKRRITGDCICHMDEMEDVIVGFINKCSVTKDVTAPLFHLDMGFGNEKAKGDDGFREGNCIGTHVTGPILVKNPAFLQYIASLLLGADAPKYNSEYAWKAYDITKRALLARLDK